MAKYKVGDLASLFPSPSKSVPNSSLQSLFRKKINVSKKGVKEKVKSIKENPGLESLRKSNIKRKKSDSNESVEETQPKFKNLKSKRDSTNVEFVRMKKKKRKMLGESQYTDVDDFQTENKPEELFYVDSNPKTEDSDIDLPIKFNKEQKLKKIKSQTQHFDDEMETFEDNSIPQKSKLSDKVKLNSQKQKSNSKAKTFGDFNSSPKSNTLNDKNFALENMMDLPCTIFVGNLPMSIDKKAITRLFQGFGPLKTVRLRGAIASKSGVPKKVAEIKKEYHEGQKSLRAFVVFKDENSAKCALSLNGILVDKHHIIVDYAIESGGKKLYDNNKSVFIGNLPFGVSDETVWSAFETFGEIHAVRIIRDKGTGAGKGFGYVQFESSEGRKEALEAKSLEIDGREVRIKAIDNNPNKKSSKEKVKIIRSNVAMKRLKSGKKKSVKKLVKHGKILHKKKQIAQIMGKPKK